MQISVVPWLFSQHFNAADLRPGKCKQRLLQSWIMLAARNLIHSMTEWESQVNTCQPSLGCRIYAVSILCCLSFLAQVSNLIAAIGSCTDHPTDCLTERRVSQNCFLNCLLFSAFFAPEDRACMSRQNSDKHQRHYLRARKPQSEISVTFLSQASPSPAKLQWGRFFHLEKSKTKKPIAWDVPLPSKIVTILGMRSFWVQRIAAIFALRHKIAFAITDKSWHFAHSSHYSKWTTPIQFCCDGANRPSPQGVLLKWGF